MNWKILKKIKINLSFSLKNFTRTILMYCDLRNYLPVVLHLPIQWGYENRSGFRMVDHVWISNGRPCPDFECLDKMTAILSKTIWNPTFEMSGFWMNLDFKCSVFRSLLYPAKYYLGIFLRNINDTSFSSIALKAVSVGLKTSFRVGISIPQI